MGTRNLTIIKDSEGKYPVAKYCQWDGYPEGQGVTLLKFLKEELTKNPFLIPDLERRVKHNVEQISEEDFKQLWVECGADPDSDFVSMEVSNKFSARYPQLTRNTGAEIVEMVYNTVGNKTLKVNNCIEFAGDSLFCEYAYMVDLQTRKLRVFEGFNKAQLTSAEEFYFLQDGEKEYKPVKEVASWLLSDLPSVKDFLDTFYEDEEE